MDTFHKIQMRLQEQYGTSRYATKKYDYDADEYPLKRILRCPECDKGVTKRKSKSKTGAYHPYYGCKTKGCSLFKKALPRAKVHEAVRQRLQELQASPEAKELINKIF